MSLPGECCCDVQDFPAPEPMQRVLEALETLQPGEYVRMMHRMEPAPLYAVLRDMNYLYEVQLEGEAPFELMIYRKGDEVAQQRAAEACGRL